MKDKNITHVHCLPDYVAYTAVNNKIYSSSTK